MSHVPRPATLRDVPALCQLKWQVERELYRGYGSEGDLLRRRQEYCSAGYLEDLVRSGGVWVTPGSHDELAAMLVAAPSPVAARTAIADHLS